MHRDEWESGGKGVWGSVLFEAGDLLEASKNASERPEDGALAGVPGSRMLPVQGLGYNAPFRGILVVESKREAAGTISFRHRESIRHSAARGPDLNRVGAVHQPELLGLTLHRDLCVAARLYKLGLVDAVDQHSRVLTK